jgi:hypothetical protein
VALIRANLSILSVSHAAFFHAACCDAPILSYMLLDPAPDTVLSHRFHWALLWRTCTHFISSDFRARLHSSPWCWRQYTPLKLW